MILIELWMGNQFCCVIFICKPNSIPTRKAQWRYITGHARLRVEYFTAYAACIQCFDRTWWRNQMEAFSALLALCAGKSPMTGKFPAQRPVTRSFDVFFHLCLNKWLSKQTWDWWFVTQSRSLWSHCNDMSAEYVICYVSLCYDYNISSKWICVIHFLISFRDALLTDAIQSIFSANEVTLNDMRKINGYRITKIACIVYACLWMYFTYQIAKILGSTSIRHHSFTFTSDRCLVDIDLNVISVQGGTRTRHAFRLS